MSGEIGILVNEGLARVRVPVPTDRVYKDECVFSFDNPETETGLFVCLNAFWGLGRDHVEGYSKKTGNTLFLHCRRIKKKIPKSQADEGPEKKITRLAIGVEGGFDGIQTQEYEIEEFFQLAVLPGFHMLPLTKDLPQEILSSVEAIKAAESATKLAELEALAGTWDGEMRQVSKYADSLVQFDNGKKIPPKGWRCEAEGCPLTENLWLNLTDGSILCGRRYFDGTGGNNHALEHFARCKYPLAVKLGTITPDGRGDVYSYDEDDMVEDPKLVQHLGHFGINVAVLEKTDKSMVEMEIELNQRQGEWNTILESGTKLKPLYGPGYTGLVNLGNSCYLNAVMQVLFTIPEFQNRFKTTKYFEQAADPANDLNAQLSKLCFGLLSGKYSSKKDQEGEEFEQAGISPVMFRSVIGRGHAEFSTKKQQDARDFFLYLINTLEKTCRAEGNPTDFLKFQVEDKVVCDVTGMCRYTYRTESCLPLPIPLEAATNFKEVADYEAAKALQQAAGGQVPEIVRPIIPPSACLAAFLERQNIDHFYSTGAGRFCTGSNYTRLVTFPDYLAVQLEKYTMGQDWAPKKLDVSVDMPFELDLSGLRGNGLQPNDVLLPENIVAKKAAPSVDEAVVSQLTEMGFSVNGARRAVISTGNAGSEAAMEWIMQHMEDDNLNDPIEVTGGQGPAVPFIPNQEAVQNIEGMGFTVEQATRALKATDNNVERAVDWIFSHMDELNEPEPAPSSNHAQQRPSPNCTDGPGKYKLLGFVSHMGTSTMVGHYVCHILKDGKWAVFNDSKVAESENLPKDLGYLYFYKRV